MTTVCFKLIQSPSIIPTLVCRAVGNVGCRRRHTTCIYFVRSKDKLELMLVYFNLIHVETQQQLNKRAEPSYHCFLALDGGAVEAQSRHIEGLALDVEDALIVLLS